jgi:hypothetical protein
MLVYVYKYKVTMQATVYIRRENEDAWDALGKKKSAWVNAQLTRITNVKIEKIDPEYKPIFGAVKVSDDEPFGPCAHLNVDKRRRICKDCGEVL